MQKRWGWALTAVGALALTIGVAIVIVFGPDSRLVTGPHAIDTDSVAVVTAPGVIGWKGLEIDVLAEVPVGKPVFVGLGNSVDVDDYVSRAAHVRVDSYSTPWKLKTSELEGQGALPAAPTALDWWIVENAGLGGARISTTLPDQTVSLAVMAVGTSTLSGLKISVAYGIQGIFLKAVGLILIGLALIWIGREFRLGRRLWRRVEDDSQDPPSVWAPIDDGAEDLDDPDELWVYVDENGVEQEITRAQALALAEAEDVEIVDTPSPRSGEHESSSPVTYVYVDDDGVEHEVSADELDAYEIVEDSDDDDSDDDDSDDEGDDDSGGVR